MLLHRYMQPLLIGICLFACVGSTFGEAIASSTPAFHWPAASNTPPSGESVQSASSSTASLPAAAVVVSPEANSVRMSAATFPLTTRGKPTATFYPNAQYVNSLATVEMKRLNITGLSLAIVENGILVHTAAFGTANRSQNIPVTPDTLFNLASVSKPITAVGLLQLAEKGKLDINAPVQKYVPFFPEKPWPITCSALLAHMGGIRHYKGNESLSRIRYTDVVTPLDIFKDDPLDHQPGTAVLYSSYGYNLLGAAVQGAAGEPFFDYMKRNVFEPAGMETVRVYDSTVDIPNQATGYMIAQDGSVVDAPVFDATNKIPSGGFVASAPTVARFAEALFNNKLLSRQTMDAMFQNQVLADGSSCPYGLGWGIGKWRGNKVASHSGKQPGFSALLYTLPNRKYAIVILTNMNNINLNDLAFKIRDAAF